MKIAAAIHDLMFSSKVNAAAAGQTIAWMPRGASMVDWATKEKPDVLLVDIGNPKTSPVESIRSLKAAEATKAMVIIGYIGHEHEETIAAAKAAGADRVLSKGAFANQLPELLKAT